MILDVMANSGIKSFSGALNETLNQFRTTAYSIKKMQKTITDVSQERDNYREAFFNLKKQMKLDLEEENKNVKS